MHTYAMKKDIRESPRYKQELSLIDAKYKKAEAKEAQAILCAFELYLNEVEDIPMHSARFAQYPLNAFMCAYIPYMHARFKDSWQDESIKWSKNDQSEQIYWHVLGNYYGFATYMYRGFVFFIGGPMYSTYFHKGLSHYIEKKTEIAQCTDKKLLDLKQQELLYLANKMTQRYKIHLMPKPGMEYYWAVLIPLMKRLWEDTEFAQLVSKFKVANNLSLNMDKYKKVLPKIVLYIHEGKKNAQKALDQIYAMFQQYEGLDITPRYNQRVTSLIYFAQGNGDDKQDEFAEYYEEPERIYYTSIILGKKKKKFHLKIPH